MAARGGGGSWSGGFWAGLTIRSNELKIFVLEFFSVFVLLFYSCVERKRIFAITC